VKIAFSKDFSFFTEIVENSDPKGFRN